MSAEATGVVQAVDPQINPGNVVENVNEHTPPPQQPPVVEHVPDPPSPNREGMDELGTLVHELADTVQTLKDIATGKACDESPNGVPWTHKGSRRTDVP